MKIRDKKGNWIEVTDLNKAIQQTGWFKEYQHSPPTESDKERQAYWADMHEKLKALKQKSNNN
ncbi:3-isopropylmalate dehydratase [Elizabethkingia anophelis]|nr:3-isopropylmalate dehydratase [Elizabethkingia anophelis]